MITREMLDTQGAVILESLTPSSLAVIAYVQTYADYATDEESAAEVLNDALALRIISEEVVVAAEAFLSALVSTKVLFPNDDSLIGAGHADKIKALVAKYRETHAKPSETSTPNLATQKIRDFASWARIHCAAQGRIKRELQECYAFWNRAGETAGFADRLDWEKVREDARNRGLAILA